MPARISHDIDTAVQILRAGGVVAIPTETVYGLAADASNADAVARVFAIKRRPSTHPLIVHLPSAAQLPDWARAVPDAAQRLADVYWPGPLTLILPRQPRVLDVVTGGQDSVGLRVPDHAMARDLLQAFGGGLAAPSANRYGRVSPTSAEHVRVELGDELDLILDGGECRVGIESSIVSFLEPQPRLLRPGAISAQDFATTLGLPKLRAGDDESPRVPGSDAAHYAPATPLRLTTSAKIWPQARALFEGDQRVTVLHHGPLPAGLPPEMHCLRMPANANAYAQVLYARLRAVDSHGSDLLLVETPPSDDSWAAVRDRLERAAVSQATRPNSRNFMDK